MIISDFNLQHSRENKPSLLSDFLTTLSKTFNQINFLFINFDRESLILDIIFFNFLKNFFVKLNSAFIKIQIRHLKKYSQPSNDSSKDSPSLDLDKLSDNSFVKSEGDLDLSSNESDLSDKDDLDRLIDFESDKGEVLQKKMVEACYGDIAKMLSKLQIFED